MSKHPALCAALALAFAAGAQAWPGPDPALQAPADEIAGADCDSLDSVPLNTNVDFETQVQPVFDNWCLSCHTGSTPANDLNLEAGFSLEALVEVPALGGGGAFTRVIPGDPRGSALFSKVNCDVPFFDGRMPQGGELPLQDQAMLYDWIYEGAKPSELSDWLLRSSFESERF